MISHLGATFQKGKQEWRNTSGCPQQTNAFHCEDSWSLAEGSLLTVPIKGHLL